MHRLADCHIILMMIHTSTSSQAISTFSSDASDVAWSSASLDTASAANERASAVHPMHSVASSDAAAALSSHFLPQTDPRLALQRVDVVSRESVAHHISGMQFQGHERQDEGEEDEELEQQEERSQAAMEDQTDIMDLHQEQEEQQERQEQDQQQVQVQVQVEVAPGAAAAVVAPRSDYSLGVGVLRELQRRVEQQQADLRTSRGRNKTLVQLLREARRREGLLQSQQEEHEQRIIGLKEEERRAQQQEYEERVRSLTASLQQCGLREEVHRAKIQKQQELLEQQQQRQHRILKEAREAETAANAAHATPSTEVGITISKAALEKAIASSREHSAEEYAILAAAFQESELHMSMLVQQLEDAKRGEESSLKKAALAEGRVELLVSQVAAMERVLLEVNAQAGLFQRCVEVMSKEQVLP